MSTVLATTLYERAHSIAFRVVGTPRPQGSKRYVGHSKAGRAILIESSDQRVRDWRGAVVEAANEAMAGRERITAPVVLRVRFEFARPKSHYGKRGLLPSAPALHTQAPDLSKLVRALEDALTDAGVWRDDSQVVGYLGLEKAWAEKAGAIVSIQVID